MSDRCIDGAGRLMHTSAVVHDDSDLLTDVVQSVLRRTSADWRVRPDGFWCHVSLPDQPIGQQGWKLHVSATPLSAPHVLSRAVAVLVRGGCGFKFARTLAGVGELVSIRCARGGGGKFITAYPDGDDQLLQLAAELHAVTSGLPGPVILSDRPYAPGSLVHYRYGAFSGIRVLTNDGSYEVRLVAPDGSLVTDRRDAWFSPPSWVALPRALGRAPWCTTGASLSPRAVVLDGRYVVHAAIQHANKGGVYRGVDRVTEAEVVIKHARAHVGSTLAGTDARDALRNEAAMLERLAGVAPRLIATLDHDGDHFLVEELVAGKSLRHWVGEQLDRVCEHDTGLPAAVILQRARQLVALVQVAHRAGVVLRDFNPNNVMVATDGALRLIDLEHVAYPGAPVIRVFTDSYAPPEVLAMPGYGPAPACSADLYSLGVTMFYVATGLHPVLPDDDPPARPVGQRLEQLIDAMAVRNRGLRLLAPAIVGLTDEDPDERWSLERVLEHLVLAERSRGGAGVAPGKPSATRAAAALFSVERHQLLAEGLDHVLENMTAKDERLWPSGSFGSATDPCNVQHGAAGVLAVLARAHEVSPEAHLLEGVRSVAEWLCQTVIAQPSGLPGLYFGRSGAAWALYEAARVLNEPDLAASAVALVRGLPVRWPNPDVCHGAAGAGLALLHLWRATADPELRERVAECADGLLAAAERRPDGLVWPIPAAFDSELAGLRHLGFAHGVAGIGAFLLAAGTSLRDPRYINAAREAGSTLVSTALVGHGEALWPYESGDATTQRPAPVHWCSGASGIGTFLVRLWHTDGDDRYRQLAELAAVAAYRRRWHDSPAACHGLAGNAEFLLDLAAAGCGDHYRDWAEELAACIYLRHARRNGRRVVADETDRCVTVDFNTGLAGVLGLLLRLTYGGPRWFMPADLVLPAGPRGIAPPVTGDRSDAMVASRRNFALSTSQPDASTAG